MLRPATLLEDAKSFLIDKLGCGPEVRVIFEHIRELEAKVAELEQRNSDLSWVVNPDRMGG